MQRDFSVESSENVYANIAILNFHIAHVLTDNDHLSQTNFLTC